MLLILLAFIATGCGTDADSSSTMTTGTAASTKVTIRDTGTSGGLVPPEQMPADFGFVAAFGVMGRNTIDTFAGTFTKDMGLNEDPVTTKLSLSPDVLESLYRDLVSMENQWQVFTTLFAPDPDPGNTGTSMIVTPHMTYRLEWQAASFSSLPIVWEDSALSADPKAAALREWFRKLQQMIEATPEWKALPPMTGGYA
jgi:hypothetical protein